MKKKNSYIFFFLMSVAEVSEQLAGLNLKEINEEQTKQVFDKVKALKQVKDVVVLSSEGKSLHSTMDVNDAEIAYE